MKTLQVTHQCFVLASITASLPHVTQSISSKPWILDKNKQSLIQNMEGWVKVQEDTAEMKFKSAEGVDEEEDGHTVEIVTDTEEQREAKEKHKKMPMNDFDEDVEVIVGTVETSTTELKDKKGDRSGKAMLVREWKSRVVKIGENAGRSKSTSRTDIVKRPGVQLIEELLEDVNSDPASSKSGAQETIHITREELSEDQIQPEDFEKNMRVQSTISPTQTVMDEEIFLNAKHEPVEWNQDKLS